MKLTIIVPDNTVYEDGLSYSDLALDTCNIPADVRVLQFNTDKSSGWLEFYPDNLGDTPPNQVIDALPEWANACMLLWDEANKKAQEIPVVIPDGNVVTKPSAT